MKVGLFIGLETCAGLGSSIHNLVISGFSNGWCTGFLFSTDGGGGMDGLHHIQFRYLCSATNIHIFVDNFRLHKESRFYLSWGSCYVRGGH